MLLEAVSFELVLGVTAVEAGIPGAGGRDVPGRLRGRPQVGAVELRSWTPPAAVIAVLVVPSLVSPSLESPALASEVEKLLAAVVAAGVDVRTGNVPATTCGGMLVLPGPLARPGDGPHGDG